MQEVLANELRHGHKQRRSLCLFDTSVSLIISASVFLGTLSGKSQTAISDLSQMGTTTLEKRHVVAFELNTYTREGKKKYQSKKA